MPRPTETPIGLTLARTAKAVSRAFDDALSAAGGSMPAWLVLVALKTTALGNQRELAESIGIKGATLTHHLNTMEADGLVVRKRYPENRRVHQVEMTEAGEAAFLRMAAAVRTFDARLREGFDEADSVRLRELLGRLESNVG